MGLFKRIRKRGSSAGTGAEAALAQLGREMIAVRLESGASVPAECTAVVITEASGQTRRVGAFGTPRLSLGEGELAWCFHPGPYVFALTPFAAACEAGLRVEFVIDAGDPRVQQQRFDLFLASEWCRAAGPLSVGEFGVVVEGAVQGALSEGMLELAPCTAIEEWHAFRAGLNELLYTRFGVTVQDCYPVDLHPATDLAATLSARLVATAAAATATTATNAAATIASAATGTAAGGAATAGLARPDATGPAAEAKPAGRADAASDAAAQPATAATGAVAASTVPHAAAAQSAGSAAPMSPAASHVPRAEPQLGEPSAPAAAALVEPAGAAAVSTPAAAAAANTTAAQTTAAKAAADARGLRRLFLELPPLTSALRMITPPSSAFAMQQELLQRLSLSALDVNTMPSLAWKSPDQQLPAADQAARAAATQQATTALDTIWSLLARLKQATEDDIPQLFDEADRLIANLEFALSTRRTIPGKASEIADTTLQGDAVIRERREPTLGNNEP